MWKKFITEYLSFSKKERIGVYVLLGILSACLVARFAWQHFVPNKIIDSQDYGKEIGQLKMLQQKSVARRQDRFKTNNYTRKYFDEEKNDEPPGVLFNFDPNTIDDAGWKKLGLKERTIKTIRNYLSKGGKFYKPEDITKIWGISEKLKQDLQPYIQIQNIKPERFGNHITSPYSFTAKKYTERSIEINIADSAALETLPGIGPKLAQRIITFRHRLGGFESVEQVAETYGLPDSTFQKIRGLLKNSEPYINQIDINKASLDELKTHPYIRYHLANAIVEYRNQHGAYKDISDLKKIMIMEEAQFQKMKPYLKLSN